MATAITAVFGATSAPFQAELVKMQTMAAASAARISAATSGGGAHGVTGMTGIIRESTVIGREIAMGRGLGRVLGSMTLLVQYLSSASRAAKQSASAANELADAWGMAAYKAQIAAIEAQKKAEASLIEAEMTGFEDDASVAAADANAAEAASAKAAAAALTQKAEAAARDAAAQEALAASTSGAGIGVFGISMLFLAAAGAAAVFYERLWGVKNLIDELQFSGAEDLGNDYVPMLERHISDAANAQRKLTDEVEKTRDAYLSAAEVAKRAADWTATEFDHKKKMTEIEERMALASAKTPSEKEAVQKTFAAKKLDLMAKQQEAEITDKLNAKKTLLGESEKKAADAAKIEVFTKQEDERDLAQATKNAEAAEKFLKGGGKMGEIKKEGAEVFGSKYGGFLSPAGWMASKMFGGNDKSIDPATVKRLEEGGEAAAQAMIAERNKIADRVQENDIKRKKKEELSSESAKAAGLAAGIDVSMKDVQNKNATALANAKAESDADIAEKKAADLRAKNADKGYSLNAQQKIGAYAATPPEWKQQVDLLRQITINTARPHPNMNRPPGAKPPQLGMRPPSPGADIFSWT
jgi:hypothetical protein